MAKVLKVSESGYYKWVSKLAEPMSEKECEDLALTEEILELFKISRGSFGSRKITELVNESHDKPVNHKRIERLMRENDLQSRTHKKYVCTTNSDHDQPVSDDLLKRDFVADRPNEKMVSDTTEIATDEGKIYVAGIIDLYGRLPVGLSLGIRNDRYLVMRAFNDMQSRGYGAKACILHSDRGSTYCSNEYQEMLRRNGFISSMSKKGDCWDNAPMESFWGKMKTEWLQHRYKTRAEAIKDIYEYVWTFYPYIRPHEANGYLTPAQYYWAA